MGLYVASFWMFLKLSLRGHGGRGLPCLAVVLAVLAAVPGAVPAGIVASPPPARIAVVNRDENPLTAALISRALREESFSGRVEAKLVQEGEDTSDCAAVVRIPEGFLDSVMSGENHAPEVTLRLSSPVEALLVREIALALERDLSNAQAGIQAVLSAPGTRGLSPEERQKLLLDANLFFADAFVSRGGRIAQEELKGAGTLSLPDFAIASGMALLLLCMTFLWADGGGALLGFGRGQRLSAFKRASLAGGVLTGILLFELAVCAALALAMGRGLRTAAPLAFLAAAFGFFFCSHFGAGESCLRVLVPAVSVMGALGGCFLPSVFLPAALQRAAQFLPTAPALALTSELFGAAAGGAAGLSAAVWTLALVALALPPWFQKGGRE